MVGLKERKWLSNLSIGLMLGFFYLPILIMIFFSFNSSRSLSVFEGFSLRWYEQLWESRDVVSAVWVSVSIAVIATIISTIVGTITAIGLSKSRKVLREAFLVINDFPIMNPEIVTAIGWMLLFVFIQLEAGYITMLLAHIAFCIPYNAYGTAYSRPLLTYECNYAFQSRVRRSESDTQQYWNNDLPLAQN